MKLHRRGIATLVNCMFKYFNLFFKTGVFRTNCIDCLDRTNVVQSLLASQNLATVLHRYGVLFAPSTLELERELAFQNVYRNAWADHANLISVQYAGTGALKTDFTRTGVRTKFGLAQVLPIIYH